MVGRPSRADAGLARARIRYKPRADHGEESYRGSNRLQGLAALWLRAEHCRDIVDRTASEFGRLDILVNNAAFQHELSRFEAMTPEQLDRMFHTNVYAWFWTAQAALKHMKHGSVIINTGPVWTPLIPSTMSEEHVKKFGADTIWKRPAQPALNAFWFCGPIT